MIREFRFRILGVALAVLWAAASGAAAAPLKIAVVSRTVFYMPLWIAADLGYFKQEGIEAAIEVFDNAEKINEQLAAGSVQIAISTTESLIVNAYKGGTFRIIASLTQRPPLFIIAKPAIKTLADLRGAKFGVLSRQEGSTFLVHDVAKAAGLNPTDYEVVPVGGAPTRWHLLQQGKIDVALQPFPLSYEAEAVGFTNLGPVSQYVPDYEFVTVFVDRNWAQANRADVVAFLRALRRGAAYMRSHPAEATAIAAKELHTSLAYAARALTDIERLGCMDEKLDISARGLARVFATVQAAGLVAREERFDRTRFVDESYLHESR